MTQSLTEHIQSSRLVVVEVKRAEGRLRVRGEADVCAELSRSEETLVVTHKEATAFPGVCPYCAVGCAQLIYVKDGKIVDIEGDPDAPHTEGALCPKGSSTYQLSLNERRITKCLYRAPGATTWEEKPLDWMMEQIAQRVKKTRDESFVESVTVADKPVTVNRCEGIAWLGSSVLDNEENYLIAKLSRGM